MPSYILMNSVAVDQAITAAEHNNILANINYLADGNANMLPPITSGSGSITVPAGVTMVYPILIGPGGSYLSAVYGGGGGECVGGALGITVTEGTVISYSVGVYNAGGSGTDTTLTVNGKTYRARAGSRSSGGAGGAAGGAGATAGTGSEGGGNSWGGIGATATVAASGYGAGGYNPNAGTGGCIIIRYSPVSQGIGAASQSLDITSADQLGEIMSSEIVVTGAFAGTRTITLPAGILSRQPITIYNTTTGASTNFTVLTSGGTGITFAPATQGQRIQVYSNGTNTYRLEPGSDLYAKLSDGGIFASHINVPAGASGTQVMQAQEVQSLIAASGGGAVILYPDATVIIPAGAGPETIPVYTLSKTPSTVTETIISGAATAGVPALMATFLDGVVGSTTIPAGEWDYPLYRYVDSSSGTTSIAACVYLNKQQTGATITITGVGTSRTATVTAGTPFVAGDYNADVTLTSYIQTPNGQFKIIGYTSTSVVTIETLSTYTNETGVAFTLDRHVLMADSGDINDTSLTLQNFSVTIPAPGISCSATDRVCIRFHAVSTGSHTAYIYYGSQNNHYSHIHTTISQDISQNIHAATAVTTLQDADEFGIWNSLTTTLGKITAANIWAWIQIKAAGVFGILIANNTWLRTDTTNGDYNAQHKNWASVTAINQWPFYAYGDATRLTGLRANGTYAAPTALIAGNPILNFNARGYNGSAFSTSSCGGINVIALENWTGAINSTYMNATTVTTGTTTTAIAWRVQDGKMFVGGNTVPTAVLHLAAGTATANTQPLKLTPGVVATAQENNTFEYDGTDLYFTNNQVTKRRPINNQYCLASLIGADFNVTTDQAILIPTGRYIIDKIVVDNASIGLTTAAGGIYTGAGKTGTIIVAAAQVYTALTATTKFLDLTLEAVVGTDILTATTIYLSLTTAQGAAATGDVHIYGRRLDQ